MMFFVLMKQQSPLDRLSTIESIVSRKAMFVNMLETGVLKHAYVKIAGGLVYILNAGSFMDVRNGFRDSSFSLGYDCEIYEIDTANSFF